MLAVAVVTSLQPAYSRAVTGRAATSAGAQVRISANGIFAGGGTLVDRNWALTVAHHFADPGDPGRYSLRFGVVDDHDHPSDRSTFRQIDRIELADEGDMALVHFADPVPPGTWIPSLATSEARFGDLAIQYGWGERGARLTVASGVVYDPAAAANADRLRSQDADFALDFPPGIDPIISSFDTVPGDSGNGLFSRVGALLGVQSWNAAYRRVNDSGNLFGPTYLPAFSQPVLRYQDWIRRIISGEGSSSPAPSPAPRSAPRRHLTEGTSTLPMTMPPQADVCEPGITSCTGSQPTWAQGVLTGAGNYRGTALARCATAETNTCSFNGLATAAGASARMALGPSSAPSAPGVRRVMVWCKTTTAFPDPTSPTRPVLRVSFTNADPNDSPIGYGWWDVTPDQVGSGTGRTLLDTSQVSPC
jgi:hypothetical protein